MPDIEKQLTISAFLKWIEGENLSMMDIERIIQIFDKNPLSLEVVDQGRAASLQVKLRSIINERFMPKQATAK